MEWVTEEILEAVDHRQLVWAIPFHRGMLPPSDPFKGLENFQSVSPTLIDCARFPAFLIISSRDPRGFVSYFGPNDNPNWRKRMKRNGEIVKGLYEAFGRGDVGAVLGAFDDGIEWLEAENFRFADHNPYRGPGAVAEGVFQRIVGSVDNFAVDVTNIVDGGETVVAEGRYRGTVGATGKPVDAQFANVWRFRDDKVVGFQQYTDTKQWAEAFA